MRNQLSDRRSAVLVVAASRSRGSVMAQTARLQAYTAPRTPWGDPDLQGQWNSQTATPLERPLTGALAGKETLTDEEAEGVEQSEPRQERFGAGRRRPRHLQLVLERYR